MSVRVLVADDEAVGGGASGGISSRTRRSSSSANPPTGPPRSTTRTLAPDIVFLDVQMPQLDGFAVLQALPPETLAAVIFVTAFDRYALQAFDRHAVDYLLKPFTRERSELALSRAKARLERRGQDRDLAALLQGVREAPRHPARVAVRSGERLVVVDWTDVDWIGAADNYVTLHVGTAEFLLRETLTRLEQELDPGQFVRIHRSSVVWIDRITELYPESHGDFTVRLRDGTTMPMSRTFRDRVERAIRWTR